jgi:hypothetical protein
VVLCCAVLSPPLDGIGVEDLPLECEDAGRYVSVTTEGFEVSLILYIFLDDAVMSLEALIMRSLRSWCSSSSARKPSNIDMIGDELVVLSCPSMAACGLLVPIEMTCIILVEWNARLQGLAV